MKKHLTAGDATTAQQQLTQQSIKASSLSILGRSDEAKDAKADLANMQREYTRRFGRTKRR